MHRLVHWQTSWPKPQSLGLPSQKYIFQIPRHQRWRRSLDSCKAQQRQDCGVILCKEHEEVHGQRNRHLLFSSWECHEVLLQALKSSSLRYLVRRRKGALNCKGPRLRCKLLSALASKKRNRLFQMQRCCALFDEVLGRLSALHSGSQYRASWVPWAEDAS